MLVIIRVIQKMLFNSFEFLLFFAIVISIYFILPQKYRWVLLLVSSYIFYMFWNSKYVVLIIISTLVDYCAGLLMYKAKKDIVRKMLILTSLVTNLGILFIFKYFDMLINIVNNISGNNFDALSLILPMGISFYTFQTLSYTIDVYRKRREPEKHIGYFALYVVYFPQLVAGPIERSSSLLPQLKQLHTFEYNRITSGLRRMLWGYFKKVVIADTLAIGVNSVYADPYHQGGSALLIATLFFGFQIYCDFSGYSDIAIGASKVMGINLMENFRRPYFSKTLKEFWKRWHISLTTWFKDYLYIPIGGSQKSKFRTYLNVMLVFLISGLWHGADLKFVVWGGIHALYQTFERIASIHKEKIRGKSAFGINRTKTFFKWLLTFSVVSIAWIFFRANDIFQAMYIIKKIAADIFQFTFFKYFNVYIQELNMDASQIISGVLGVFILILYELYEEIKGINVFEASQDKKFLRWGLYYFLILYIMLFGVFKESAFIYFQF